MAHAERNTSSSGVNEFVRSLSASIVPMTSPLEDDTTGKIASAPVDPNVVK